MDFVATRVILAFFGGYLVLVYISNKMFDQLVVHGDYQ